MIFIFTPMRVGWKITLVFKELKLPMLAWLVIVVNAIVLFYVCIFPGFSVADQAANPPNTKGMFTFDGNSFLTFTLPNYEIYSSVSENIQNLLTNQIKSPIISCESRLPIPVLF